ncbi:hypothetical protein EON83_29945 [bacterium]|nr:MAG: hypothetical protein EON83_29945 [bacterium]
MTWHIDSRYDFSIPEAQWLADLCGVGSDLDSVIRLCKTVTTGAERLIRKPEEDALGWFDDIQMVGDLAFAAVIRYGRTLTSGIRDGIPREWIEELPAELKEAHNYFKTLRDKYIAHSVNALEDNQVFVFLKPQFSDAQEPSAITVDRGRLIAPGLKEIALLSEIATCLKQRVETEVASESARILEIARNMPIDEIRMRSKESLPIPGKQETFQPRSKFKNGS